VQQASTEVFAEAIRPLQPARNGLGNDALG